MDVKAIIIAAGKGSRLNPLTKDRPKCMLELNGKTLLMHQMDALRAAGVDRIVVIKGYRQEVINYPGIEYCLNSDYENNNILSSLFYAQKQMEGGFIAAYSDIFYSKDIVKRLLESKSDISIVVDIDWRQSYEGRKLHPLEEAENVVFDADNNVISIGKMLPDKDAVFGEFIGMMKCTAKGAATFSKYFDRVRQVYSGKPFQRVSSFEKAYLTDIFQDMADYGVKINCVIIEKGWVEIDTIEDYNRALKELKESQA